MEAAEVAIKSGADFLGFIFIPASRRSIDPELAKGIIKQVAGKATVVGVFQEEAIETVKQLRDDLGLDYVQLHGNENQAYCEGLGGGIIKVKRVANDDSADAIISSLSQFKNELVLLDRAKQGEGELLAPDIVTSIAQEYKVFLSGGLTPENVVERIAASRPFGVDVSGGVETKGEQDTMKIQQFIYEAKGSSEA